MLFKFTFTRGVTFREAYIYIYIHLYYVYLCEFFFCFAIKNIAMLLETTFMQSCSSIFFNKFVRCTLYIYISPNTLAKHY